MQDNSGVKFYVTKNLRPIEFGILITGALAVPSAQIIPPKVENMPHDYYCPRKCMDVSIFLFRFYLK
jgi:hypothetical protein